MNWKKIDKYFSNFVLGLVYFGAISLIILSIIGGIQTGDLTWLGLPVWFWNNVNVLYFFLGCFTVGGVSESILKNMGDKEKDAITAATMLLFSGLLWPVVWSVIVFDWFRKRSKRGET